MKGPLQLNIHFWLSEQDKQSTIISYLENPNYKKEHKIFERPPSNSANKDNNIPNIILQVGLGRQDVHRPCPKLSIQPSLTIRTLTA